MKIAIVEFGGELAKVLQSELSKKMETSTFETKKSLDLFDVLAYARKMIDSDQLVLIAQLNPDEKELNTIFMRGWRLSRKRQARTSSNAYIWKTRTARPRSESWL
jgi:hypothetical protein